MQTRLTTTFACAFADYVQPNDRPPRRKLPARPVGRRRAMTLLLLLLPLAAAAVLPTPADAQGATRIVDDRGRPIAGARVEVWNGTSRESIAFSDDSGWVFIRDGDPERGVLIRKIAYQPANLRVGDTRVHSEIVLRPVVVPLSRVVVEDRRDACKAGNPDSALAMLRVLGRTYSRVPPAHGVAWRAVVDSSLVATSDLGDYSTAHDDSTGRLVGAAQIEADWHRLERGEYAVRTGLVSSRARRAESWRTVPLEVYLLAFLLSPAFIDQHRVGLSRQNDRFRISFCPKRGGQGLIGDLIAESDSSLSSVSYSIRLEGVRRAPSAQVVFVPPRRTDPLPRYLFPAQSVSWWPSQIGVDWYVQRRMTFSFFEVRSCDYGRC